MLSVPSPFGGPILKAAAYMAGRRNPQRHLYDTAVLRHCGLLCCVADPYDEREQLAGSDRARPAVLGGVPRRSLRRLKGAKWMAKRWPKHEVTGRVGL
jgi:hypothetical protein